MHCQTGLLGISEQRHFRITDAALIRITKAGCMSLADAGLFRIANSAARFSVAGHTALSEVNAGSVGVSEETGHTTLTTGHIAEATGRAALSKLITRRRSAADVSRPFRVADGSARLSLSEVAGCMCVSHLTPCVRLTESRHLRVAFCAGVFRVAKDAAATHIAEATRGAHVSKGAGILHLSEVHSRRCYHGF